jgi:aromatic ring-opening dioxygenase LigB subunit
VSVVFAAIAPHGSLAVAEACSEDELPLAAATCVGLEELGRRFAAAEPEATIVLTPHNVHIEGSMAVILAGQMEGEEPVPLACPVDRELALAALGALWEADVPAVGVSFGGNDPLAASMPLDWGSLIPLWFMGRDEVPVVVVSPARDLPPELHVRAGEAIAAAAGKRVALIASADHGHAHDPGGPYGFDPAAERYDRLAVELVGENRLADLSGIEPELVEAAKADSFWQMLMLHGALGDGFDVELLSYECPTYFGMLCAAYAPRKED